jgi:hypothetical protein
MRTQFNQIYQRLKNQHQKNGWEVNESRLRQQAWMLNDRIIFEATNNNAAAASSAAAGAGAGGSGNKRDSLSFLYGVGFDSIIYFLGLNESSTNIVLPTSYQVVCVKNTDDNQIYFTDKIYFGTVNLSTGEINLIDNNIIDMASSYVASMYYEGGGNFILLDSFIKSGVPGIIRVNVDGVASLVNTISTDTYYLEQLFVYDGQVYGISITGGYSTIIGQFDINLGDYSSEPVTLTINVPGYENLSGYTLSTVSYNGKVYANILYIFDGHPIDIGLFEIDMNGFVANYIKSLFLPFDGNVLVSNLFNS